MSLNLIQKVYAASIGDPGTSLAGSTVGDYKTLLSSIATNILDPLIGLMAVIALLYFLWGVLQFIRNAESSEERKKGGQHILWGVIGLFIMISAYGIINLILGTLGKS